MSFIAAAGYLRFVNICINILEINYIFTSRFKCLIFVDNIFLAWGRMEDELRELSDYLNIGHDHFSYLSGIRIVYIFRLENCKTV